MRNLKNITASFIVGLGLTGCANNSSLPTIESISKKYDLKDGIIRNVSKDIREFEKLDRFEESLKKEGFKFYQMQERDKPNDKIFGIGYRPFRSVNGFELGIERQNYGRDDFQGYVSLTIEFGK